MPQTPKGDGMDNPVAVTLKNIARSAHILRKFGI